MKGPFRSLPGEPVEGLGFRVQYADDHEGHHHHHHHPTKKQLSLVGEGDWQRCFSCSAPHGLGAVVEWSRTVWDSMPAESCYSAQLRFVSVRLVSIPVGSGYRVA